MTIIKVIKPALLVLLIAMIISFYILGAGPVVTAQFFPENSITLEKAIVPHHVFSLGLRMPFPQVLIPSSVLQQLKMAL